jgi:membrane protease subunit HflC
MMGHKLPFLLIVFLASYILTDQATFIVPQASQAMVFQFGRPVAKYTTPGLKFKTPFIQQVRVFDKRVLDVDPPPEEVILADQKRLVVDTFARYRITDMLAFSTTLQTEDQAALRLDNIINSVMRSVMGNAALSDVLSEKRIALMTGIKGEVNKATAAFGIEIVDVRIGRADLPEQTSQSIYARMKAQRQQEAAEFRAQGQEAAQEIKSKADKERTVLLATAEKQAQISRGEGDKEAIRIYADAFKRDPQFYNFYRTMEAYKSALGGDNTTLILKPEGEFFRFMKEGAERK